MTRRYVSLWFPYLVTDWFARRHPELRDKTFVMTALERGRPAVAALNQTARRSGIRPGMALADARALIPDLEALDHKPEFAAKLLAALAEWCGAYTPGVEIDGEDGLTLDITGCAHLRGGEHHYLRDIVVRLRTAGYEVRGAMADTIGAAWAVARFGKDRPIIASGMQKEALALLPPESLRIEEAHSERLRALGIRTLSDLYKIPRAALNRRFGEQLTLRLAQALGDLPEVLTPRKTPAPFEVRLISADGIATAEGIAKALRHLLAQLCDRLCASGMGARELRFTGHRLDGKIEEIAIGTSRPSRDPAHLVKLFSDKLPKIEPALGIELFILSAPRVEEFTADQDAMVTGGKSQDDALPQMLDRLANRLGGNVLSKFEPRERHWPERSFARAQGLDAKDDLTWSCSSPRPIRLIMPPEPVEVAAPVPDYPPLFFILRGKRHRVRKADGPERIEREWWIETGEPRDYFQVEDDDGGRYWLFRAGAYAQDQPARWYLHGIFA